MDVENLKEHSDPLHILRPVHVPSLSQLENAK